MSGRTQTAVDAIMHVETAHPVTLAPALEASSTAPRRTAADAGAGEVAQQVAVVELRRPRMHGDEVCGHVRMSVHAMNASAIRRKMGGRVWPIHLSNMRYICLLVLTTSSGVTCVRAQV